MTAVPYASAFERVATQHHSERPTTPVPCPACTSAFTALEDDRQRLRETADRLSMELETAHRTIGRITGGLA